MFRERRVEQRERERELSSIESSIPLQLYTVEISFNRGLPILRSVVNFESIGKISCMENISQSKDRVR